jgi:hypothetical protein
MTQQDIDILIKYLQKAIVPQAEQAQFIKAFERLMSLKLKSRQAA